MAILINVTDVKAKGVYRPPLRAYDHFYSFVETRYYLCRGRATSGSWHASETCIISLLVAVKDRTSWSFEHDLATQLMHPLPPYISLLSYIPSYLAYPARVFINVIEAEIKLGESFFAIAIGQPIYAPERLPQFGIYSSFQLFELYFKSYLETINNAGYFEVTTLPLPFRRSIERWTYPTPFSLTM